MLPRLRNSNETRPSPLGNAPLRVARFAQAGRWLSDRMAKRNSYVGRLKAAVYADMVGYSRLFRLDDAGTVARLRNMHRMLRPAFRLYHGRLVQTGGDSMLITFDSLTEAVRCAVAMQYALELQNDGWPDDRRMELRVGVDLGDVIVDGTDFHGDGVIMAVRLQEVCPPGGVCISAAVHDRGGDRLGLPFERLGAVMLKNIAQPVEAFVLRPASGGRADALRLIV